MVGLLKRERQGVDPFETFGWFDRFFDDWPAQLPFGRTLTAGAAPEGMIRVDELRENGTLVIRAEMPGIDPAKDVELTVSNGMLHIKAERREEESTEEKGYVRRELRYGSFARTLPLPEGVSQEDVTAAYKNGILEVRLPVGKTEEVRKIPVTTS